MDGRVLYRMPSLWPPGLCLRLLLSISRLDRAEMEVDIRLKKLFPQLPISQGKFVLRPDILATTYARYRSVLIRSLQQAVKLCFHP